MPKVSIVVPVYNVEKYLNRCIDSILNQTFKDFELILVDDGSHDKSGKICDEYNVQDNRVKVIHKRNEGVSVARNTGLGVATGKYIMFVDSDDYIKEDMLCSLYVIAEENYDLVFSEIEMLTIQSKQLFNMKEQIYNTKQIIEAYCLQSFPIINICGPCAKLYRNDIIKINKIYFNKELNNGEDTYFNFCYLQYCKKIKAVNKAFYVYIRDNEESLFSKVREYAYRDECKVFFFVKELAEKYACSKQAINSLIQMHILSAIALVNKAVMTTDKKICIGLMKEMYANECFLSNMYTLKDKKKYYFIACLIKNRSYIVAYYICWLWRKLKD